MSDLAAAVRGLALEIQEARKAEKSCTDGTTDTVDALEIVSEALGNLIAVAKRVVDSWDTC